MVGDLAVTGVGHLGVMVKVAPYFSHLKVFSLVSSFSLLPGGVGIEFCLELTDVG